MLRDAHPLWNLNGLAAAVIAAGELELSQTKVVWKALDRAKLPRKGKDMAGQILWKKKTWWGIGWKAQE